MTITFLSDFGLQDDFVGTCHGVIKRIAPHSDVIDITHGIERYQVLQGALVLANTLPYMPEGVHLAVVDPGVGTERRALALRGGDGRLYVGPATAAVLSEHGIDPDLVPVVASQDGLLAELPRPAGRVLVAAAEGARRLLVDQLGADFVPLYRTVELRADPAPSGDLVVLASSSAARALAALRLELPAVSIGPQTTAAAREAGVRVVAEAETHDAQGLLKAIASLAS